MPPPLKLFYSYSHKDEDLRDELEKHLTTLFRMGFIENWHDRRINPGKDWNEEINKHLLEADIILFLISVDFISSDYCHSVEVSEAMKKHEKGNAKCIPIFLRECIFSTAPFGKLQGLPRDAHFVTSTDYWNDLDKPFTEITKELENEIQVLWEKRSPNKIESSPLIRTEDIRESEDDLVAALRLLTEKEKALNPLSTEIDIQEIRSLREKVLNQINISQYKIDNIPSLVEKYPIDLFNAIYSTETLSSQLKNEIENVRSSENYKWYHRSLIVSALTLSIINFKKVDQFKILCLIDFIKDEEDKVWEKAISGLAIALIYRKNSWLRFSLVTQRLKSLKQNEKIQHGLKAIAFILENSLFDLYFESDHIFKIDYYQKNPAHCFIPFYENNNAIKFFYQNTSLDDPEKFIEAVTKTPLPDITKYYLCYVEIKEEEQNRTTTKQKNFINYLLRTASTFEPFVQYLSELYAFINFYPSENKEKVFTEQLTLSETKLKDYLLNEVEKHRVVGIHFMHNKNFSVAATHFKNLLKIKENDLETLKNFVTCLKKQRKLDELIESLLKIEKLTPDDMDIILELASAFSKKNDRMLTEAYCTRTLSTKFKKSDQYIVRAQIWKYLYENDKSLLDYDKAIELNPRNEESFLGRAVFYLNNHDEKKSYIDLSKALSMNPKNVETHVYFGTYYSRCCNFEKALEHYNQAIKLDPKWESAFANRGVTYQRMKQYEKALSDFDKAVDLSPRYETGLIYRGVFFLKMREYDKALSDFNEVIRLYPKKEEAYVQKADYFMKMKNFEEAIKNFNIAADLDDKNENVLNERALYFQEVGDQENCLKDLNTALKLAPINSNVHLHLGMFYLDLHKYEDALKHFKKALELDEHSFIGYIGQGIVFFRTKQFDESLKCFHNSLQINRYGIEAFYGMATINRLQGNHEEAIELFNKVKKIDPEILNTDQASSYYCCYAEIMASQGKEEEFFNNMVLAFQNGLDISAIEPDIIDKYKSNPKFIALISQYGKSLKR